jgi:uncharacterized protein YecE (DUF72 family)
MTIRIGIAGWSIAAKEQHRFASGDSHLARYATRFNAAEINSSFYRPHHRATYERWADSVPADFRFSVKLPRAISHDGRLTDTEAALDEFAGQVTGLGKKLGPLLTQLPPSLPFDAVIAGKFFRALRARFDGPLVCEPRHKSWFGEKPDVLLKKYRVLRVAADPAPAPEAAHPGGWARLRYFRWHGSPVMYRSAYGRKRLEPLAAQLKAGDWCILDNTTLGAALPDAFCLQEIVAAADFPSPAKRTAAKRGSR